MAVTVVLAAHFVVPPASGADPPDCRDAPGFNLIVSTDDVVEGTEGHDFICLWGDRAQTAFGLGGNDVIRGSVYDDIIYGGPGNDHLFGSWGNDHLFGDGGNDTILGYRGDDTIVAGPGADRVLGGSGDDRINGGHGHDDLQGNSGHDTVHGRRGNDVLDGGPGNDRLLGGLGRDILRGDTGNDFLRGHAGRDSLYGEADRDVVDGRRGTDSCYGERSINCESGETKSLTFTIERRGDSQATPVIYATSRLDPGTPIRLEIWRDSTKQGEPRTSTTVVDEDGHWWFETDRSLARMNVVLVRNETTGDESARAVGFELRVAERAEGELRLFGAGQIGIPVVATFTDHSSALEGPVTAQTTIGADGFWSVAINAEGLNDAWVRVDQIDSSGNVVREVRNHL